MVRKSSKWKLGFVHYITKFTIYWSSLYRDLSVPTCWNVSQKKFNFMNLMFLKDQALFDNLWQNSNVVSKFVRLDYWIFFKIFVERESLADSIHIWNGSEKIVTCLYNMYEWHTHITYLIWFFKYYITLLAKFRKKKTILILRLFA